MTMHHLNATALWSTALGALLLLASAGCSKSDQRPPKGNPFDGGSGSAGTAGAAGTAGSGGTGGGSAGTAGAGASGGQDGGTDAGEDAGEDAASDAASDAEEDVVAVVTCDMRIGRELCDDCIQRRCVQECHRCEVDDGCFAIVECIKTSCLGNGGALDMQCAMNCRNAFPQGSTLFNATVLSSSSCAQSLCGGYCVP